MRIRKFEYATWRSSFLRKCGSACRLDTCPTEPGGANASLPGDAVARRVVRVMVACISDVSWVISTPRAPVPVSLHLGALQLNPGAISSGDREILFLEVTNHQLDMFQTYSEVLCLNYHFFFRGHV